MKAVGARRRGEISAILALCLATVGSSCGGDGVDAAGPTTTINQNAKAQAEAIVVKLSDLPVGYRVYTSSQTGEEGVDEGPDVSNECAGTESIKDKVIGDADDAEYETDLTYVSSDAAIFESPEDAEAAMAQLREVVADPSFEDCLEEVMEKSIVEGTEVGEVTVFDLDVSLPAGADELVAWRMQVPIEVMDPSSGAIELTTSMDFAFLRGGDATAILLTLGLSEPFDEALRDSLLETIAGRM